MEATGDNVNPGKVSVGIGGPSGCIMRVTFDWDYHFVKHGLQMSGLRLGGYFRQVDMLANSC